MGALLYKTLKYFWITIQESITHSSPKGVTRAVDPDPHSFSFLDADSDQGGDNFEGENRKKQGN